MCANNDRCLCRAVNTDHWLERFRNGNAEAAVKRLDAAGDRLRSIEEKYRGHR